MRRLWLQFLLVPALLGGGAAASAAESERNAAMGIRLTRMGSCAELVGYGVKHALPLVGPYGLGDPYGRRPIFPRAAQFSGPPQGRDFSTTNVQEEGIDEPDLVKTDGDHLFVVADGRLQVLSARRKLRRLAELTLPPNREHELLLRRNRLLVLSYGGTRPSWLPGGLRKASRYVADTIVTEVDISRPSRPTIARMLTLTGAYLAGRMQDGIVRLVTVSSIPNRVAFESPTGWDEAAYAAATARNRELLAGAPAEDWLPRATFIDARRGRTESRPLVHCRHVWRPAEFSGLGLTTVTTLDVDDGLRLADTDAILSDAEIVYASHEGLVVATERWGDRPEPGAPLRAPAGVRTLLHKFGTGGTTTRYRGSGAVEGYLMNQWSLSEHEGVLRVASTERPVWWGGTAAAEEQGSFVTALVERAGKLVPVGRVAGLGRGEQVYAVRFAGELGFVVTFRITDPLYTVDLSRPAHPVVRGRLDLPGYSAYLHPVEPRLLLGVGQEGDEAGTLFGVQLSLFDVSDPRRPRRVQETRFGKRSSAEAERDHRAFLYWPPAKLAVVPVRLPRYYTDLAIALAYRVDRKGIELLGKVSHGEEEILRSVVIGDSLFTISRRGVKRNGLRALAVRDWVEFPAPLLAR